MQGVIDRMCKVRLLTLAYDEQVSGRCNRQLSLCISLYKYVEFRGNSGDLLCKPDLSKRILRFCKNYSLHHLKQTPSRDPRLIPLHNKQISVGLQGDLGAIK